MKIKSLKALLITATLIYFPLRGEVKDLSWFKSSVCTDMAITKFNSISDDTIVASVMIRNSAAVKSIMDRIKSLPAQGEEMVSWGPKASRTVLSFRCGEKTEEIEIINKQFKTPSTAFSSKTNPIEESLVQDMDALVEPKLNARIPKMKDHPVEFKNFSVMFIGAENTQQAPNGPTVGPTTRNFFQIHETSSPNLVTLNIFDGQMPPQPQAFVIGKKIYYLLTYQNYGNESLYPGHFAISEKLPK